jgi:hypothetical protein
MTRARPSQFFKHMMVQHPKRSSNILARQPQLAAKRFLRVGLNKILCRQMIHLNSLKQTMTTISDAYDEATKQSAAHSETLSGLEAPL